MDIKLLSNRVMIEECEESQLESGIYIPMSAREKEFKGTVVAVGKGMWSDGEIMPMETEVGDEVIYSKYAGTEVEYKNKKYTILREVDVLAVVKG